MSHKIPTVLSRFEVEPSTFHDGRRSPTPSTAVRRKWQSTLSSLYVVFNKGGDIHFDWRIGDPTYRKCLFRLAPPFGLHCVCRSQSGLAEAILMRGVTIHGGWLPVHLLASHAFPAESLKQAPGFFGARTELKVMKAAAGNVRHKCRSPRCAVRQTRAS